MRRAWAIVVSGWLFFLVLALSPVMAEQKDDSRIDLPLTIEKLWFQSGGKRRQGYLMISDEGLEFTARKRTFSIPLERIQFISFGTMKGDVDTEWILLTVGVTPPFDLVGLRDGKKWGFGGRTDEIYGNLRAAIRQLSAAQYSVVPGHKVYEDPGQGFALGIPEDWHVYVESLVVVSDRSPWGTTIVSEQPIRSVEKKPDGKVESRDDLELLDAILAGESQGFFIERGPAGRGVGCEGISNKGRERLIARAEEDIVFGENYDTLDPPSASPITVSGCDGLRIVGRSRRADGAEVILDLVATAQGDSLFLFGLRALAPNYDEYRRIFDDSITTLKLPRRPANLD